MGEITPLVQRGRVAAGSRTRVLKAADVAAAIVAHRRLTGSGWADGTLEPGHRGLAPGCTVAVCTYRRPVSVARFLDSLAQQSPAAAQLVVVDASPDDETERMLMTHPAATRLAPEVEYIRVRAPFAGLTRQRNVALRLSAHERVAFFDDDIVLLPGCLAAMAGGFDQGVGIVGVGAVIENERTSPPTLWRIRRALRIVPSLTPGRYTRSGFQIPWHFLPVTDSLIDGEWLPGGATMWATALAREIGFHEGLDGYASGEDLEFSLQMRRHGRLTMAGMARLLHLQDWGARPNAVQMGYMGLRNLFYIHQEWHRRERARATTAFVYGYGLDTVVRFAALARPGNVAVRWQFIRGRLRFFREVIGMTRNSAG